jgi:CheY-like chemotaxis protein
MTATDQSRRILVLDDAPAVAESLALILSRAGFGVKVAHSAEDAIQLMTHWQPDVAFVDIMLPGINGIEFSDVLGRKYPQCEIALMSGHPAAGDLMENARQEGREFSVLPKPFEPDRFIAIARGDETVAAGNEKRVDTAALPFGPETPTDGADEESGKNTQDQGEVIGKPGDPGGVV